MNNKLIGCLILFRNRKPRWAEIPSFIFTKSILLKDSVITQQIEMKICKG